MSHPILILQAGLVAALGADADLAGLVGTAVFDAPPQGAEPPYVTIHRHDLAPRDGDLAPGHAHRLVLHVWAGQASRRAALAIAERVLAVTLAAPLATPGLVITLRRHDRTETTIDHRTGTARAAVMVQIYSEPAA